MDGACVVQSVEWPALCFGSGHDLMGHDLMGHEMEPAWIIELHAQQGVCLKILSLSVSLSLSLCVCQINKSLKNNNFPKWLLDSQSHQQCNSFSWL